MNARGRASFVFAVLGASILNVVMPQPSAAAPPSALQECGTLQPAGTLIGREQRERRMLGFRCDGGFVQSLSAGHSPVAEARQPFGLSLTPNELTELGLRQAMARAMAAGPMASYLDGLGGFAGDYLDNLAGGKAVFLFTSPVSEGDVSGRFAFPGRVVVRQVRHTAAELANLESRIASDRLRLESMGVRVTSLDIDVPANQVVVAVSDNSPTVRATFGRLYGPADEVVVRSGRPDATMTAPGVCVIPPPTSIRCGVTDAPTYKGGQEIDNVDNFGGINPGIRICTSGFSVGRFSFPAGTSPFVLSAGHCAFGSSQPSWMQQATPIGTVQSNSFINSTDAMILPVPAGSASNQVFFLLGRRPNQRCLPLSHRS
jgi:hypothetical protein